MSIPYEQTLVFGNMAGSVFYRTPQWKRARYMALTTFGNRCQLCGAGPATGPLHVDHIKPRSLYPELCLDPTNLQVLCEDCHTAKGLTFMDDCRAKLTKKPALHMADFLRIERHHLVLDKRPPHPAELDNLGKGIRAASDRHRARFRLFVKFCCLAKLNWHQGIKTTVAEFIVSPWAKNHQFNKFMHHPDLGEKNTDDLLFDINSTPFPRSLHSLLADDQRVCYIRGS